MNVIRITRAAARARPSISRIASQRRGYADPVSDKIQLTLALPHQSIYKSTDFLHLGNLTVADQSTIRYSVQVNIPAESGEMGVLANHVPSIEQLKPGLVEIIEESGGSKQFFLSGGFAIVQPGSQLSINAVEGFPLEEFSSDAVRSQITEAQKIANGSGSEQDIAEAKIELEVQEFLILQLSSVLTPGRSSRACNHPKGGDVFHLKKDLSDSTDNSPQTSSCNFPEPFNKDHSLSKPELFEECHEASTPSTLHSLPTANSREDFVAGPLVSESPSLYQEVSSWPATSQGSGDVGTASTSEEELGNLINRLIGTKRSDEMGDLCGTDPHGTAVVCQGFAADAGRNSFLKIDRPDSKPKESNYSSRHENGGSEDDLLLLTRLRPLEGSSMTSSSRSQSSGLPGQRARTDKERRSSTVDTLLQGGSLDATATNAKPFPSIFSPFSEPMDLESKSKVYLNGKSPKVKGNSKRVRKQGSQTNEPFSEAAEDLPVEATLQSTIGSHGEQSPEHSSRMQPPPRNVAMQSDQEPLSYMHNPTRARKLSKLKIEDVTQDDRGIRRLRIVVSMDGPDNLVIQAELLNKISMSTTSENDGKKATDE
ncbi:uncharacterized protein KY384_008329 [Bacidia gigantensis]|nr:uncharacterized protein KY384_008329 [Bacidia gigantensis]KAG8526900.1 hypothetical protein KY384_008329 [Bacidia gigantensis]